MILLASNSTTRKKILDAYSVEHIQKGTQFDEDTIATTIPKQFVYEATVGKYKEALQSFGLDKPLLVSDTVVSCENRLLRKPVDQSDAREMLELQSNNTTQVLTCMIYKTKSLEFVDISMTEYQLQAFDQEDLERYITSNECMGKAGAIMVEGFCKPYIQSVHGYESCAMGLTIEKLLPFID